MRFTDRTRRFSAAMAPVIAPVLIVALSACGCSSAVTSIETILENTNEYVNQEVTIEGRVTSARSVPLTSIGLFWLHDGTGELAILPIGEVPAVESQLRVTGVVANVLSVQGLGVALHLRETSRTVVGY